MDRVPAPENKPPQGLVGRNIIVTRPAGQSTHLAEALLDAGAHPVLFPLLVIRPVEDLHNLLDVAARLDQFQLAVFVSPNAVQHALDPILSHRPWPRHLRAATVGRSSEAALAARGITDVIAPSDRFDSEALLALPALQQVAGWKVIVFRGDGGRELLGEVLQERGAQVEYVTAYRRSKPDAGPEPLIKLWQAHKLDAITLTSSEGLRNLHELLGPLGQSYLRHTPVFVPHVRIAEQAHALGLQQVVTTGPADDGLMTGLMQYFRDEQR